MKQYELDSKTKRTLKRIKSGQSINLAYWAAGVLKSEKITGSQFRKLRRIEGVGTHNGIWTHWKR